MRYPYEETLAYQPDSALLERSEQLRLKLYLAHKFNACIRRLVPSGRGRSISRAVSRSLLPPLCQPVICPTLMGFDLIVSQDDGGNYYYDGCYEAGTLHVMKSCLRDGDTFIDVGASIGQMALYASNIVGEHGRVLAFEPHPKRFASLAMAVALNARRNVTAFRAGLGETSAEMKLYTNRASPSLIGSETEADFESVQVHRLDELLAQEGVANVRMIKIDVEGFEFAVLKGAADLLASCQSPLLCIEHERFGGDPLAPLRFLQEANAYRFFQLTGRKSRASRLQPLKSLEDARLGDNLFCLLPQHQEECAASGLLARNY